MKQELIIAVINNDMVINKNVSKSWKFVEVFFAETVFVWTVFVSSIISLKVITESSIILPKYVPFWQMHLSAFQI